MKSIIPSAAMNSQAVYGAPAERDDQFSSLKSMEDYLNTIEKNFFNRVLSRADGNKSKAAEILGIKRTTLNDRLKKLGLL
jgi:transcriptional regulator with PAS, ATPase and Fis domain